MNAPPTLREVHSPEEKSRICRTILEALPHWFGIPESIDDYVAGVATQDRPFLGIFDGDVPQGFMSLTVHNPHTVEIYVMGIVETLHRRGLGRQLVQWGRDYGRKHGMTFLTVKTLAAQHPDEYYKRTRLFYEAMGFVPLEVFPLLWDESNPCLFMAQYIGK